jgi:hypothetical protein
MRSISPLLLCSALAGVAFGACAEEDVNEACGDTIVTRIDPNTDFSRIQTFAVVDEDDYPRELPHDLPPSTDKDIFAANGVARASLIAHGLREVDPDFETPDVWLFSLAATKTETGYEWACVPGYAWWGVTWDFSYCTWFQAIPVTYEVGTVLIGLAQVHDDRTGEVVFGGAVQGVLDCADPRERLQKGVEKIFAEYPG